MEQQREVQERLVVELAVATANRMRTQRCGSEDQPFPGYVFHSHMSAFTAPCRILWSLDLAVAAYGEGQGGSGLREEDVSPRDFPPFFLFAEEDDIRRQLAVQPVSDDATLHGLIDAYLYLAFDYDGLDHSHDWFMPDMSYAPLLDAFAAAGYADKNGADYRWSDKMAPHMIALGNWTESGREVRDVQRDELRAFLTQLPDSQRLELIDMARRPGSYLFVMKWVMDRFYDEDWVRHFPTFGASPQTIARELYPLVGGED